ncbi:MAG: SUMF1/EgtB/PvdO family nonheme iron enzyme [Candidatus Cloacimonetes bacterium]|nr:SUMF1/EgtB/PvdO family nonheme iron enzyme [Candidatus Cloacimonadota bacterium]
MIEKSRKIVALALIILVCSPLAGQTPEMIEIPAGSFVMGADSLGLIEHPVTLTNNFEIGRFEITVLEFCDVLNYALSEEELLIIPEESVKNLNGDQQELLDLDSNTCMIDFTGFEFVFSAGMEQFPVVELTWYGAAFYCNILSRIHGFSELYDLNSWQCQIYSESGFRLPTEAEWEYAARYNDQRFYPWGNEPPDSTRVNCFGLGIGGLAEVGIYSPNGDSELGCSEFCGNVWEWCNDWFDEYSIACQIDPTGPDNGIRKVIRGAGWMSPISQVSAVQRSRNYQDHSYFDFGFRIVFIPEEVSIDDELETEPVKFKVYPNPFNPSTTIYFEITSLRNATSRQANSHELSRIEIYNLKGQKVKTLPVNPSQSHTGSLTWNGTDDRGKPVSSGMYFYSIRTENKHIYKGKMLLLK